MEPWADELVQSTQVALERKKVGARTAVVREAALSARMDLGTLLADQLTLQLESHVLAERLVGEQHVVRGALPFPSSAWQHFKHDHRRAWWLRWLVRRRPPKYTRHPYSHDVRFERYALFPNSTLQVPALGAPVVVEQYTDRRLR